MAELLRDLKEKLQRDAQLPWRVVARKAARYAADLASAPLYLRAVDEVGRGVRTTGRPRIENLGFMHIGDDVLIRSVNVPVELCTSAYGRLVIGDGARINYGASIGATGEIRIGDRVRIGPYAMIVDSDFHDPYDRARRPAPEPVTIDDDAWIGAKASVLRGVHIGRGAIVGTSAVVTRDVPPFTVVAGIPARPLYTLDEGRFATRSGHDRPARA